MRVGDIYINRRNNKHRVVILDIRPNWIEISQVINGKKVKKKHRLDKRTLNKFYESFNVN